MAFTDIAERRQLRRKLTFWRVAAFFLIAAVIVGVGSFFFGSDEPGKIQAHIARVTVSGLVVDDPELVDRLDAIAKNDSVKGLIVSLNTPGGTTYGGEQTYKAIRRVADKKPVVSDVRTLAASAGYMIAIAGDHIVAGETCPITGSIGVIFQYPQVKGLLDKLGVSLEEIKSAPLKAEPSPFHAPPGAKVAMQAMVDDSFAWFVDLVAQRRHTQRPNALRLADGRVFTGRQAKKENLIDTVGGEKEIRAYFTSKKIPADLPIVDWKPKQEGSNFFLGSLAMQLADSVGLGWLANAATLKNMSEDKLLLDGLVSVWHFEGK